MDQTLLVVLLICFPCRRQGVSHAFETQTSRCPICSFGKQEDPPVWIITSNSAEKILQYFPIWTSRWITALETTTLGRLGGEQFLTPTDYEVESCHHLEHHLEYLLIMRSSSLEELSSGKGPIEVLSCSPVHIYIRRLAAIEHRNRIL